MITVTNRQVLEHLAAYTGDTGLQSFLKKLAVKTKHIPPEAYESLGAAPLVALELSNAEGHLHKEDVLLIWPDVDKKVLGQLLKAQ